MSAVVLPLTATERKRRFGVIQFRAEPIETNPERIRITNGWAQDNVIAVHVRQLHALFGLTSVNFHRAGAEALIALWQDWDDAGLLKHVRSWNGSYVPRFKRQNGTIADRMAKCATLGEASLSDHTYANAFDINAHEYPLGKPISPVDPFCQLFPIAKARGFSCGADFRNRPDPMHFAFVGSPPAEITVPGILRAARLLIEAEAAIRLGGARSAFDIKAWQAAIGVKADGKIGAKTLAKAREIAGVK